MDEHRSSTRILAIGNQKGGTGKTTIAVHLAAAFGRMGRSCLLVDLDPAAGATHHLGVPPDAFAGTVELITSEEPLEALVVTKGMPAGIALIPARPELSALEAILPRHSDRTHLLDRVSQEAKGSYDYVLFDTAPYAAFATTVAAYAVSEWFMLAAFPHPLSLGGLTEAFRDIAEVRRSGQHSLGVLGVVLTNVDRRASRMTQAIEQAIRQSAPGMLFNTSIAQAIAIPRASGQGCTVFDLADSAGVSSAQQFMALAGEVEERLRHSEEAGTHPSPASVGAVG